jgi:hypothetical protein
VQLFSVFVFGACHDVRHPSGDKDTYQSFIKTTIPEISIMGGGVAVKIAHFDVDNTS